MQREKDSCLAFLTIGRQEIPLFAIPTTPSRGDNGWYSESQRQLPRLLSPRPNPEPIPGVYLQMLYQNDWSWLVAGNCGHRREPAYSKSIEKRPEYLEAAPRSSPK